MKKLIVRFLLSYIKKELENYIQKRIEVLHLRTINYINSLEELQLSDKFIIKVVDEINKRQLK